MTDDTWIALDFETATRERGSACSLGIAVVECGAVVETRTWLIQPPGNVYEGMNVRVHGIDEDDTAQSPTFAELYPTLWTYLDGRNVLAHSAGFDMSVLRSCVTASEMPLPRLKYVCTCTMARRAFPSLRDHRLPTICTHCDIPLAHHDAGSDALACALVAVSCRDRAGASSIHEALDLLGITPAAL